MENKELMLVEDFTLSYIIIQLSPGESTHHSPTRPPGTWSRLGTRADFGRANGAEVEASAFA